MNWVSASLQRPPDTGAVPSRSQRSSRPTVSPPSRCHTITRCTRPARLFRSAAHARADLPTHRIEIIILLAVCSPQGGAGSRGVTSIDHEIKGLWVHRSRLIVKVNFARRGSIRFVQRNLRMHLWRKFLETVRQEVRDGRGVTTSTHWGGRAVGCPMAHSTQPHTLAKLQVPTASARCHISSLVSLMGGDDQLVAERTEPDRRVHKFADGHQKSRPYR